MDVADVAKLTGLDEKSAMLAKKREYEETLNLEGTEQEIQFILNKIAEAGLKWSKGGRFYGVSRGSDKGKAAKVVIGLLEEKLGKIKTIGIGDSFNDVPMLSEVDYPVLVQKPGDYWEEIELKNLHRISGVGPAGWVRAVEELMGQF
jgi:predicted mannosyl-3-phosphoglycerate phosphatase (HAD superfamily)